jgi:hypothetical protein
MAAPDPLAVRAYKGAVTRHQKKAERSLASLQQAVRNLRPDLRSLGDAQRAAVTLTELISALSALEAAVELDFLTEEG